MTQTVPDISPLMPMHQDPLLVWVLTSPCMLIYMGMIQGALRIWICIYYGAPRRFIKEVFCIRVVSSSWNTLSPWVKESTSSNDCKHNFRLLNGRIHPEFMVLLIFMLILYTILMLSFYQFHLQLVPWKNSVTIKYPPPPTPPSIHLRHP